MITTICEHCGKEQAKELVSFWASEGRIYLCDKCSELPINEIYPDKLKCINQQKHQEETILTVI